MQEETRSVPSNSDMMSDFGGVVAVRRRNSPDEERRRKKRLLKAKDYAENILITIIPFVGFLLFGITPMILSLVMSFSEMHTTQMVDANWIGIQNYIDIFTGKIPGIGYAYLSTLIYMLNVPLGMVINIFIANLINKATYGKRLARFIYFIPYVCSSVALSFMFSLLLRENGGVFNNILNTFGFENVRWLAQSPVSFMLCVVLVTMWSGSGYSIVLLSASLSKVDKTYYEAAMLDGATDFQMFWKITLPAITPTMSYMLTIGLIGSLQVMNEPMILLNEVKDFPPYWTDAVTGEHLANGAHTVVFLIYNMAYQNSYTFGFGIASASAWILTIIILVLTRVNLRLQKRWVNYDF